MSRRIENVVVLGATGSIGASTLDVIARHPDRYRAFAVTAHSRAEELVEICRRMAPSYAVIGERMAYTTLRERIGRVAPNTVVLQGADALASVAAAPEADTVMAAIVGAAGLSPTLAAAAAGKRVLLANKEALVMAGPVFMAAVRSSGARLLPIDSEHNAIFQCLPPVRSNTPRIDASAGVRRILLTGSGGPFRRTPLAEFATVTPDQACAHPTWSMGRKISCDSATMMNKALEIIEAHWLFEVEPRRIEVVVHPQSVIHSMVEYDDGSVLAQLGNPDMRTPIAQALAYPDRIEAGVTALDLARIGSLTFEAPDFDRFPSLRLAYDVLGSGGSASAIFNAANEVAVEAFLDGRVPFLAITSIIRTALEKTSIAPIVNLEDVLEADRAGRDAAKAQLGRWSC